jgi:outer membrane protein OmpA-like peptidoglycan-associated protein
MICIIIEQMKKWINHIITRSSHHNYALMIVLLVTILLPTLSFSQPNVITHHRLKGDSLREAGQLSKAILAYKTEFNNNPQHAINTYNLACALAIAGQTDSAFIYLNYYLRTETEVIDFNGLLDPDLFNLHEDPRWRPFEQGYLKLFQKFTKNLIKDEEYALLLIRLRASDQYYRIQVMQVEKKSGMNSTEAQKLWAKQNNIDEQNLQILLKTIEQKGWPKISQVGAAAASGAFLIVQHSNIETMEKFLPELKRLCEKNEARWPDYALMYDRVEVARTGAQLYGSQVYYDQKKNQWALEPITDEENLDKRRTEMGLVPMEEYVTNWNIKYKSKRSSKPLPARLAGYPVDTVFRRGQRIIRQYSSFSETRTGYFPLGWGIGCKQGRMLDFLRFGFTGNDITYVGVLNEQRALIVFDSANAKVWDNTASLDLSGNNYSDFQLPNSFTLECGFYLEDSVCQKNGGCEFAVVFKEPKAKFKNELNLRISGNGDFEMNCDANDSSLGPNTYKDYETFYWSYVRSTGKNTKFHQEVKGAFPAPYDKKSWHKVTLSYSHWQLCCWLDGRFLGSMNSCITPVTFRFASVATFGINNFVLAELNDEDDLVTLSTSKKLVTHAVNFDVNGYDVKEESKPFLRQLADWMNNNKSARLEISGHTDASGNGKANVELSQKRADSIKDLLVSFGISEDRLTTKGFGATKPMYSNETEEGKAGNRRVEFCVL